MLKNRLFQMLIATAFAIAVAFAVREVVAKANVASEVNAARESRAFECANLPSRHSIHTEYVQERGTWVTYTEDGPTGVDGGLLQLLSDYRTCSK